ncbi:ribonuclease Y, partial [Micromonospora chalcea]
MSAFDIVLLVVVLLLVVVVVGAVLFGVRTLKRLSLAPAPEDPAFIAEKDRQEQSLAALRTAASEANSTIDVAKSAAADARASRPA